MMSILRLIAVQLLILLLLLILGDLLLHAFLPVDNFAPAQTRIVQSIEGVKRETTYSEFRGGFRALTLRSLVKPAGSTRILCLGASTTQQSNQATEDTWCAILETLLKTKISWRRFIHLRWVLREAGSLTTHSGCTLTSNASNPTSSLRF